MLDLRASGVISGTLFCLEAELSRSTKRNVENIFFLLLFVEQKKSINRLSDKLQKSAKSLISNSQKYVGSGHFDPF